MIEEYLKRACENNGIGQIHDKIMSASGLLPKETLELVKIPLENINKEIYEKREEERQANLQTAENTLEMKEDIKIVIRNQNEYIEILKGQNQLMKNMFLSSEDSVNVQKEIMQILQEQGECDDTFKDKGLDVTIQAVFMAIQIWLKSRGIDF